MSDFSGFQSTAFRFVKFIGSGGVAAVVHTAVMFAFIHFGVGPHRAFLAGFTSGVVVRFFVDRSVVFHATDRDVRVQFVRYGVAAVAAYCISAALFYTFLELLHWHQLIAFAASVVLTTIIGYGLIRTALGGVRKTTA